MELSAKIREEKSVIDLTDDFDERFGGEYETERKMVSHRAQSHKLMSIVHIQGREDHLRFHIL